MKFNILLVYANLLILTRNCFISSNLFKDEEKIKKNSNSSMKINFDKKLNSKGKKNLLKNITSNDHNSFYGNKNHRIIMSYNNSSLDIKDDDTILYQKNIYDIYGTIFINGWIKYYKSFFRNNKEFDGSPNLFKINPDLELKILNKGNIFDRASHLIYTNKFKFFAAQYSDSIKIFSDKNTNRSRIIDEIYLDDLDPISSIPFSKGDGIEDIGSFNIGHCIKLNKKFLNDEFFIICFENLFRKKFFMKTILKLKQNIKNIQSSSLYFMIQNKNVTKEKNDPKSIERKNDNMTFTKILLKKNDIPIDGKWIIEGDWSNCNRDCGGGKSYIRRVCIGGKSGGKDCEGLPYLERDCQIHPCDEFLIEKREISHDDNDEVINLEIVGKNFSVFEINNHNLSRLFEERKSGNEKNQSLVEKDIGIKCLKDELKDNFVYIDLSENENKNIILVDAILNKDLLKIINPNKNINEYLYLKNLSLLNNEKISEVSFDTSQYCLLLKDYVNNKNIKLCNLSKNGISIIELWVLNFKLFKKNCITISEGLISDQSYTGFNLKKREIITTGTIQSLKAKINDLSQNENSKKLNELYDMTITSLKKIDENYMIQLTNEVSLEELIKHKINNKLEEDELELIEKIHQEKRKKERLIKMLKERKLNHTELKPREKVREIDNRANIKRLMMEKNHNDITISIRKSRKHRDFIVANKTKKIKINKRNSNRTSKNNKKRRIKILLDV